MAGARDDDQRSTDRPPPGGVDVYSADTRVGSMPAALLESLKEQGVAVDPRTRAAIQASRPAPPPVHVPAPESSSVPRVYERSFEPDDCATQVHQGGSKIALGPPPDSSNGLESDATNVISKHKLGPPILDHEMTSAETPIATSRMRGATSAPPSPPRPPPIQKATLPLAASAPSFPAMPSAPHAMSPRGGVPSAPSNGAMHSPRGGMPSAPPQSPRAPQGFPPPPFAHSPQGGVPAAPPPMAHSPQGGVPSAPQHPFPSAPFGQPYAPMQQAYGAPPVYEPKPVSNVRWLVVVLVSFAVALAVFAAVVSRLL